MSGLDDFTNYVIAVRNPRSKRLSFIMKDDETVAEFESEEDAREAADNTTICKAWGFELVEITAPPVHANHGAGR
jgi:hypothetical protein